MSAKRSAKAASGPERSMAKKIRDAIEANKAGGPPVTPEARKWLAKYEREHPRRGALGTFISGPAPTSAPPAAPPAKKAAPPPTPAADVEDDDEDDDDEDDDDDQEDAPSGEHTVGRKKLSFDDGEAGGGGAPPANDIPRVCPGGPNCPGCKGVNGSATCISTGKQVWEPIDDETAEALADFVLGGIEFAARVLRPDHARIEPSERDVSRMTKAARKLTHRRANAIGEYEDLLLGGFAIANYSKRAFTAPAPEKPQRREPPRDEPMEQSASPGE